MRVEYSSLPMSGSIGSPSATVELSLSCVKTSEHLVSHLINNLPAYILVCASPSAGIQPQTAFRPRASGLGQQSRLPVLASHCLIYTTQFHWHGCPFYTQSAILQNSCGGSDRDSVERVEIHPSIYAALCLTGKVILTCQRPVNRICGGKEKKPTCICYGKLRRKYFLAQGLSSLIKYRILRQMRRLMDVIQLMMIVFIETTSAQAIYI